MWSSHSNIFIILQNLFTKIAKHQLRAATTLDGGGSGLLFHHGSHSLCVITCSLDNKKNIISIEKKKKEKKIPEAQDVLHLKPLLPSSSSSVIIIVVSYSCGHQLWLCDDDAGGQGCSTCSDVVVTQNNFYFKVISAHP